jgi:hypothetical protein
MLAAPTIGKIRRKRIEEELMGMKSKALSKVNRHVYTMCPYNDGKKDPSFSGHRTLFLFYNHLQLHRDGEQPPHEKHKNKIGLLFPSSECVRSPTFKNVSKHKEAFPCRHMQGTSS